MRDLIAYWISLGPDGQSFTVGFVVGFAKGLRR